MSEEARPATSTCLGCGKTFPISQLEWFESEGGFFESGRYCKLCATNLDIEEDQIDSEDIFDLDDDDP